MHKFYGRRREDFYFWCAKMYAALEQKKCITFFGDILVSGVPDEDTTKGYCNSEGSINTRAW